MTLPAASMVYSLNSAHRYFMADNPRKATMSALDLLEESAKTAYRNVHCPFDIVPRVNIATVYMTYYFEHSKPAMTIKKSFLKLSEAHRELLDYRYLTFYEKMDKLCQQTKCTSYESSLKVFSKALYDDVHKNKEVDLEVLVVRSLALRKLISEGIWVSKNPNTLLQLNSDLPSVFNVLKRYLYTDPVLSVQDRFKLSIFNTLIAETEGYSSCPPLLYDYFVALELSLNNTKEYDLIQYIAMTGHLFEALNKSLYVGTFNRNQFCTLKDNNYMYSLPFDFSKEVKNMIYATLH